MEKGSRTKTKAKLPVKHLIKNVSPVSELNLSRMEQFKKANEGRLENYIESCCFCKVEMTDIYKTHNPYPLNKNEDAACCKKCCDDLVGPARMFLIMNSRTQ